MSEFEFTLMQVVTIAGGKEQGKVIGMAKYLHGENQYLVLYIAGDGRAAKEWWGESELTAA